MGTPPGRRGFCFAAGAEQGRARLWYFAIPKRGEVDEQGSRVRSKRVARRVDERKPGGKKTARGLQRFGGAGRRNRDQSVRHKERSMRSRGRKERNRRRCDRVRPTADGGTIGRGPCFGRGLTRPGRVTRKRPVLIAPQHPRPVRPRFRRGAPRADSKLGWPVPTPPPNGGRGAQV